MRRKYLSVAEAVHLSSGLRYGSNVTQLTFTSWNVMYLSLTLCKFNPIRMDISKNSQGAQYESLELIILLNSLPTLPTCHFNDFTNLHLYACPRALCIVSPVGIANAEPSTSIQRLAHKSRWIRKNFLCLGSLV